MQKLVETVELNQIKNYFKSSNPSIQNFIQQWLFSKSFYEIHESHERKKYILIEFTKEFIEALQKEIVSCEYALTKKLCAKIPIKTVPSSPNLLQNLRHPKSTYRKKRSDSACMKSLKIFYETDSSLFQIERKDEFLSMKL